MGCAQSAPDSFDRVVFQRGNRNELQRRPHSEFFVRQYSEQQAIIFDPGCLGMSPVVAGDLLLTRDDFQIRLAPAANASAECGLVERMYASRGYRCDVATVQRGTAVTLQACDGQSIFGTLTVRYDSSDGLAADELYKPEIDAYRGAGGVCELTRLAIDPEFGSKELLGALFHIAYFFAGPLGGARHMIIEVNPRHVSFYRRMLGFRTAGDCKICPRVESPAVLLSLEVAHAAAQIANCAGQGAVAKTRSLYPYFCSPSESEKVADRGALLARLETYLPARRSGSGSKACASHSPANASSVSSALVM